MGKKLSDSLSQFISSSSSFDNPFDNSTDEKNVDLDKFVSSVETTKKDKKKKDPFADVFEKSKELSKLWDEDDIIDDFESYLGEFLLDDEDEEFRRNLIRYGRKYARDTRQSGESSEIQKAYAQQETELEELIKAIDEDKEALGNDIKKMRTYRSINFKAFADLMEARTSLHNTHLQAIKEMDSIIKNKIDLQMKADKEKKDSESDDSSMASRMVQNLFSMGRDNIMGSYADISGSSEAGSNDQIDGFDEDQYIQEKILDSEEEEYLSDGDKYMQYEDVFDKLVLEYNDQGPVQAYAVDVDGNPIPDYPIGDISELEFNISESTGTATDNLSQNYEAIKID